jgi:hypothetical protein
VLNARREMYRVRRETWTWLPGTNPSIKHQLEIKRCADLDGSLSPIVIVDFLPRKSGSGYGQVGTLIRDMRNLGTNKNKTQNSQIIFI